MKITEYWAKLVAAGLAPNYENMYAIYGKFVTADESTEYGWYFTSTLDDDDLDYYDFYPSIECEKCCEDTVIQLRKDGVNLYELEWRIPKHEDIGKMCYESTCFCYYDIGIRKVYDSDFHPDIENCNCKHKKYSCYSSNYFCELDTEYYQGNDVCNDRCLQNKLLLVEHGQIAPTLEDFKKVYGE